MEEAPEAIEQEVESHTTQCIQVIDYESLALYKTHGTYAKIKTLLDEASKKPQHTVREQNDIWYQLQFCAKKVTSIEIPQTYLLHEAIDHNDLPEVQRLIDTYGTLIIAKAGFDTDTLPLAERTATRFENNPGAKEINRNIQELIKQHNEHVIIRGIQHKNKML